MKAALVLVAALVGVMKVFVNKFTRFDPIAKFLKISMANYYEFPQDDYDYDYGHGFWPGAGLLRKRSDPAISYNYF